MLDHKIVADAIELIRRHAGSNRLSDGVDRTRCNPTGLADAVDLLLIVDIDSGEGRFGLSDVFGANNRVRNLTLW